MKLRRKWVVTLLGLCAPLLSFAGCGNDIMESWPPKGLDLSTRDMDTLITLCGRSNIPLEQQVLGGRDFRVSEVAYPEIAKRLGQQGLERLTQRQRKKLLSVLRSKLRDPLARPAHWKFAIQYAPDQTLDQFKVQPVHVTSEWVWESLLKAHRRRTVDVIRRHLGSWDDWEIMAAHTLIASNKIRELLDDVYPQVDDWRWAVRLSAMQTLAMLKDPRTAEALARHVSDIERGSCWLGLFLAHGVNYVWVGMGEGSLRDYVAEAMCLYRTPGAAAAFERIALHSWIGGPWDYGLNVRIYACVLLLKLDRERGNRVTRALLNSRSAGERRIGVETLKYGEQEKVVRLEEFRDDLVRLKVDHPKTEAAETAARLLKRIGGAGPRPPSRDR